jgi:hypothetical protein
MRRVFGGLVLLVGVAAAGPALEQPESNPIGKRMEVTGTVADTARYFNNGRHGPSHVPWGAMCAKAGVPFAIRAADGRIYIPAVHAERKNPKRLPFVEQSVSVTGTVYPAAGAIPSRSPRSPRKS